MQSVPCTDENFQKLLNIALWNAIYMLFYSMAKLAVLKIFEGVLVLIHQTGITFIRLAGFQSNKK